MLSDFRFFAGRHWDTGPLLNALAYQGVRAPHTGQPLTAALLFGISGGIVAGYFVFEYAGHPPWLHFLTRNTFAPMERVVEQLGIETVVKQTPNAGKAASNLEAALAAGQPALVWADAFSLPYNNLERQAPDNQAMLPVLVFGQDDARVHIAGWAEVPLTVAADTFAAARGQVKSTKHRLLTVESVALARLPDAVKNGLHTCLEHMTGPPPRKPMAGKYGLDAYQKWADALVDTRTKDGWTKKFPPGPALYEGLTRPFYYMNFWDAGGPLSRQLFADFLDEAAVILERPGLNAVTDQFREIVGLWDELNLALLPDEVPQLQTARQLMQREYELFRTQGNNSLTERQAISQQLADHRDKVSADFPLSEAEVRRHLEHLHDVLLRIRAAEQSALAALRAALS